MKIDLYTKTGTKSESKFDLPDSFFGIKVNKPLVNKYIRFYLSNQRQSNASVKTRGDVSGGGKKPWKQKGTGRARAGSLRSPIFKGGGVAFGPSNSDNYKLKMNKKERNLALRSTLSAHAADKTLKVFESLNITETKKSESLSKVLDKASIKGKVLIVLGKDQKDVYLASSNIPNVSTEVVTSINAYLIAKYPTLIFTKDAIEQLQSIWPEYFNVEKSNK